MKKLKKNILLPLANFALGVLIALTPFYIFPVCEKYGMYIDVGGGAQIVMKCTHTGRAEAGLGIFIAFLAILLYFAKNRETGRYLNLILALAAILVYLMPTYLIGVCKSPAMPCVSGTLPALEVLSVSLLTLNLAAFFTKRKG